MTRPENPNAFDATAIDAIYRTIHSRRDIREFIPGPLPDGLLSRLYAAAHAAPSVGFMQPWRLIHVVDAALRDEMITLVETERQATATVLPSRTTEFLKLKVEGMKTCAEVLVVALMDGCENHIFGKRTLPEMALASAACAIQNMWLAARAEGIGLGWVSFFEPEALARLFAMPPGAKPIAILCIGHVAEFPAQPMLEALGWGQRLPLESVVFENQWLKDAQPTPTAY
ncbi:cob(II)yrinic acid a,c-diamide reductase [Rugosibacter aromaticivorans]|uniref:Cob(II)yrinic acid a,c-diamide reductase n=1 Tax=Rugosibacter aromaticivorans TaxID=1565605 RepID=A0A0C5J9Q6_9PROT|nr:5,6-dimethylbenzimidazole synthase [Rugosibacter aromaticivorans]AJP48434.1 cob(II)yrinic acid a,c-diamide reductase [Rugosibacter aromaticivorans]TBR15293.1 MAG: 5,6-dimethylbenzimidazole synthase [Rugosibacter sp.]